MDKTCTDDVLSEAVREFPVIYDKSKSGHKDRLIISNCSIFALLYCFYLNQPFPILIYVKMRCLELITFVKFIKLLFVQKHMSTYRHKTFERLEFL